MSHMSHFFAFSFFEIALQGSF